MESLVVLGYLASALIGISLGLVGGGGSILTVPILVYLFGIDVMAATSYSLFIVGATSLLGSIRHQRLGNLNIRTALVFALPSIISSLLVRSLVLPSIPDILFTVGGFSLGKSSFLLVLLAMLMLLASRSMIVGKPAASLPHQPRLQRLIVIGLGVGTVTGLLGAGGGFLIIPALVLFAGTPMKQAVGTSLLIIFLNAAITFLGDLQHGTSLDWPLLLIVTAIAFVGMFTGTWLSTRISGEQLKPAFGWFVLAMGIYVLIKELVLR